MWRADPSLNLWLLRILAEDPTVLLSAIILEFEVVILLEDPRPATETRQHISLQSALLLWEFHDILNRIKTPCARWNGMFMGSTTMKTLMFSVKAKKL